MFFPKGRRSASEASREAVAKDDQARTERKPKGALQAGARKVRSTVPEAASEKARFRESDINPSPLYDALFT